MAWLPSFVSRHLLCALPPLFSTSLWAQVEDVPREARGGARANETEASAAAEANEPGDGDASTQEEGAAVADAQRGSGSAPAWKLGLAHYSVGEHDEALGTLRPRILECEMEQSSCSTDERATLFASLAIVQAGGTGDHRGAVQSFRRALTYRADLVLLPQYQTPPIVLAFEEAQTGQPADGASSSTASGLVPLSDDDANDDDANDDDANDDNDDDDDDAPSGSDSGRGNLFLLTMGDVEYLQLEAGNRDLFGRSTDRDALELSEGQTLLRGGGDVTAGIIPSDSSGFTFGLRLRGGGIWGDEATPYGSMEAVIGSVMGPRRDHTFFYLLGSFGASYYSKADIGAFSAGFRGGASFGRFSFAACFSTLANENLAGLGIGLQLGLGQLFDFQGD